MTQLTQLQSEIVSVCMRHYRLGIQTIGEVHYRLTGEKAMEGLKSLRIEGGKVVATYAVGEVVVPIRANIR